MLKFFRKYMKYMLAVFASLLMVVFVLPMQQCGPSRQRGDYVVASFVGGEITQGDLNAASIEMQLVQQVGKGRLQVPYDAEGRNPDSLAWFLALHEATENMGLWASNAEVFTLVNQMLNANAADLAAAAERHGVSVPFVEEALRNWLIMAQYRKLTGGMGITPASERALLTQAFNERMMTAYYQALYGNQEMAARIQRSAGVYLDAAAGTPRVSQPLMQHMISESQSLLTLELLRIDAEQHIKQAGEPDAARVEKLVKELYDKYKSDPKGTSKPYGFGYRLPNRVKIEFVALPFESVKQKVKVEESDIYDYYAENQFEFVAPESTDPLAEDPAGEDKPKKRYKEYKEVRSTIEDRLKDKAASDLSERIMRQVSKQLEDERRMAGLPRTKDGGLDTSKFNPAPLSEVVDRLANNPDYGIRMDVVRQDRDWQTYEMLNELPGIKDAVLPIPNRGELPFAQYVFRVEELIGEDQEDVLRLNLQAKVPSQAMIDFATGDRYLFRVIATAENRDPESLDEVRAQVQADARRLAAYEDLKTKHEEWRGLAIRKSLVTLAEENELEMAQPDPFPRRIHNGGEQFVPVVADLGQEAAFVDGVFKLAGEIAGPDGTLAGARPASTYGVFDVDGKQSLAVIQLREYKPLSLHEYTESVDDPGMAFAVMRTVDESRSDPIDRDQLVKRLKFEWDNEKSDDEDADKTDGDKADDAEKTDETKKDATAAR